MHENARSAYPKSDFGVLALGEICVSWGFIDDSGSLRGVISARVRTSRVFMREGENVMRFCLLRDELCPGSRLGARRSCAWSAAGR